MLSSNGILPESSLASGLSTSAISYEDALENYRRNTDWWLVFDSFDLSDAKGSALWIATRTGVTVEVVTEALEGLTVLGVVRRSDKGFEKARATMELPDGGRSKAQRVDDHALVSQQILNHLDAGSRGAIRYSSFASNSKIIADLYQKIDNALLEAQALSRALDKSQIDSVYLATFTAVNGIPNQTQRGDSHA